MNGAASRRIAAAWPTLAGALVLLTVWQTVGSTALQASHAVPTPLAVVASMLRDGIDFYTGNAATTLQEAAVGWVIGNGLAILVGLTCVAVPSLARPVTTAGIATFCLPSVAILPIFAIIWSGQVPEIALAALAVYFTTFVGLVSGLRSADTAALDLVAALGGGRIRQLVTVKVRYALPSLFAALKVAAPSAILGAMIGEFIGGTSGLGVAMISSEQALDIPRTWGIAVFAAAVAGTGYAITALVGRLASAGITAPPVLAADARATVGDGRSSGLVRSAVRALTAAVVLLVLWWGFLVAFQVDPFIGKTPLDVAGYLLAPSDANGTAAIVAETAVSLGHAIVGLTVGVAGGVVAALMFSRFALLHRMFFPIAVVVSTVPLVAFTPLIALVFGRGLASVAVIGGIVTFFPVLVFVVQGLSSADPAAIDLATAYGSGRWATLLRVRLPWAVPALVAALRVAAPLALVGALLAEWLATGDGLGNSILTTGALSDYDGVWARVAVSTACSFALYLAVGAVEHLVATRMLGLGQVGEHSIQADLPLSTRAREEPATV